MERVASFTGGGTPSKDNPKFWNGNIPWASMKDVHGQFLLSTIDSITEEGLASKASISICLPGQLIVSTRLTPGKSIISKIKCAINQDLKVVHSNEDTNYLFSWFESNREHFMQLGMGTTVPGIKLDDLNNALIPLPPRNEQVRIADKIATIEPVITQYDTLETEREQLDAELPERLRKSILQMAVQGMLVAQDPSDEPASELLERIREERRKLIANGKMKAPKGGESVIYRGSDGGYYEKRIDVKGNESEPVCIDDEIPFEIPTSWEWCRLGSLALNRKQLKPSTTFNYIDIGSIDNKNQKLNSEENFIKPSKAPSRARKPVELNDVLYATVRPYLHNACVVDNEYKHPSIASTGFAAITCPAGLLPSYLLHTFISPYFDEYANSNENSKGVAYPAINDDRLYKALIPLPPTEEQCRIIKCISGSSLLTNQ